MQTRSDIIDDFLRRSGWQDGRRAPLAGDASFRKYERVHGAGRQAVLMDAPPDKEDMRPFIHIGEHLMEQGLSAPQIYARDLAHGLLLLEDLGDGLFTRLLRDAPQEEERYYIAAADVLAELYRQAQKADYSGFPVYDEARLLAEANLLAEWFLPAVMTEERAREAAKRYTELWRGLLAKLPRLRPVLVLRDYHADNLLWLPQREGIKAVGLLDFQDGVIGSPAYDMVSFLEDARRDVAPATVERVLAYYLERTGMAAEDFATAYALLGAQRNCKIVGIFVRLAVRDGKRNYLSYLPRVWGHLQRDLLHPALQPLKQWIDEVVEPAWRGAITPLPVKTQASA